MAKVALAAALLLALVALSTAARYTTTVITTSVDDETANPGQQQQCQRQLQGRQFRSCQRYLSSSGPYDEGIAVLEMSTDSDINPGQQEQQSLRQCCQELKNVNEQCQCEALKHAVRQSQGGSWGEQGQQGQSQVYRKAMNLPRQCQFRQQQCQIRAIFV